jgi:Flp pilus assembly protein TadD
MRRVLPICLVLFASTFVLYWPVRNHDFVDFDDPSFITHNPAIKEGFTRESLRYAFTTPLVGNWHPITTLSHELDCQLFGTKPGPQHLVSATIHALNAVMLFLALYAMTGAPWRCAAVAAIFALHPLRVESVAWIAERKDVVSAFFFFATIWAYAKYAAAKFEISKLPPPSDSDAASEPNSQSKNPSTLHASRTTHHAFLFYFLALLLFALGLMSKPMLVTVPFVLLLLDIWPLRRAQIGKFILFGQKRFGRTGVQQPRMLRPLLVEKAPFFALSAASSVITLRLQKGELGQGTEISLDARLLNAIVSYCRYLGKFVWPTRLSIQYPHPVTSYDPASVWPMWAIGTGAFALLTVSILCLWQVRSRPYLAVGWFWFLGTLIPVIGLVQVGEQAMADRYTYIPLIGPTLSLVWLFSDLFVSITAKREGRSYAVEASIGVLLLGVYLAESAITRRQLKHWENTVSLFTHALEVTPNNPGVEVSLGVGLENQGRPEEAMPHYRHAIEVNPSYFIAHYNLAQLLKRDGKWAEAAEHYAAVTALKPNDVPAHYNLALALQQLGRYGEAIQRYEETLKLAPDFVEALNNLAWLLATNPDPALRDGPRAVQLAERACQLTDYRQTLVVGTLAAAYAEAGRWPEAVATAEKACALAEAAGQQNLLERNQELLKLYRAGKTYGSAE